MTRVLQVEIIEKDGSNLRSVRELLKGLGENRHLAPKDHQHHLRATQIGVAASV